MGQRRPSLLFRFAGLFTLGMLAVMTLAYGFLAPKPTRPAGEGSAASAAADDDPRWGEAKAWVGEHAGTALVVCAWPKDLPRGGRVDLGAPDAPSFWDDGRLVQAVPDESRGGLVRASDGAPRAWVSFDGGRCTVVRPASVRVQGSVFEGEVGVPVEGCGQSGTSDAEGRFTFALSRDALEVAEAGPKGGPRCMVGRPGGPGTPVDLAIGGIQNVVVQ